jgi:hypothetical protein
MVYVMHVAAAQAIAASTTLAARDELLRAIAGGRHLTTLALSEKGSRSQFWAPVSRLEARDAVLVTTAATTTPAKARGPRPAPPNATGTQRPSRPARASVPTLSVGKRAARSTSAACMASVERTMSSAVATAVVAPSSKRYGCSM